MSKIISHYINGEMRTAAGEKHFPIYNPATGEITAQTPCATQAEINDAILAAKKAFAQWSTVPPLKRARAIELVEFSCGTPYLLQGHYSENVGTDVDTRTMKQALGICVGISPFNFPIMISTWMQSRCCFDCACGNTTGKTCNGAVSTIC